MKYCLTPSDDGDRAKNIPEVGVENPLLKDLGGGTRPGVGRGLGQKLAKFDTRSVQGV